MPKFYPLDGLLDRYPVAYIGFFYPYVFDLYFGVFAFCATGYGLRAPYGTYVTIAASFFVKSTL